MISEMRQKRQLKKEVAKILRQSSIFVYPVIWEEPFGLAPVEAMAVGIPTVVSKGRSGYMEIINEKNGYFFRNNDSVDLERVLRNILLNIDGSKDISMNAIKTVQNKLSWKKCIEKTIECFSSI